MREEASGTFFSEAIRPSSRLTRYTSGRFVRITFSQHEQKMVPQWALPNVWTAVEASIKDIAVQYEQRFALKLEVEFVPKLRVRPE